MRHITFALCCLVIALHLHFDSRAQTPYDDLTYTKGTFFGNSNNDSYLLHVAVDAQGYIYGTGHCTSIPTTAGAYRTTSAGASDVMVFKLDPTMRTLIWATYIGGSGNDAGGSIAVNAAGEVFVSGYTMSPNFPTTVATDNTYLASSVVNYFALKLSANGSTLMYSRILGNGSPVTIQTQVASKGAHICINPNNEAFVYSQTNSFNRYQITANAFQSVLSGNTDLVLTKLSATGAITYSTYIGAIAPETSGDICYANGKVYISGTTGSTAFPLKTGKVTDAADCFVMVADDGPTPIIRKSLVYGSAGSDAGIAVAYDAHANRVCLTGTTQSAMPNSTSLLAGAISGGFVAAIDSSLTSFSYITMIGTNSVPTSVVARKNSAVYVAGYTSGGIPFTPNAFQNTPQGLLDGIMISIDSAGTGLRYGTYMGGNNNDYSAAKVLLYEQGCVLKVIFGITSHSPNFPSTSTTYQPNKLNGTEDQPALAIYSTIIDVSVSQLIKECLREVTLSMTSLCPPTSVKWDFGDGTAILQAPSPVTHTYSKAGRYVATISLAFSDGDTIKIKREIIITSTFSVEAGDDRHICSGDTITLSAQGASSAYRWTPGRAVSDSTISNPRVWPTKTTKYYVRGFDAFGCEAIDSVTVNVHEVHVTAKKDTIICEGSTAILQATGIGVGTYISWFPIAGLNTNTGGTVRATPKATTTYTAVISDGYCLDSSHVTVTVIPKPKAKMGQAQEFCVGANVELLAGVDSTVNSDGLKFQWTAADGMTNPTIANPVVTPKKTTWYYVTITTKDGCTTRDSIQAIIKTKITITAIQDRKLCYGDSVRLWASGASSYIWSPAEGLSSTTSATPLCTPTKTTTYKVIGNSGGCSDTTTMTVTVNPLPVVEALGDTTVCSGENIRFSVKDAQSTLSYSWFPAGDFTNNLGSTVTLKSGKASKYYIVEARNAFGCVSHDSVFVKIDDALTVATGQDTAVCLGEEVILNITTAHDANTTFTWFPNTGTFDATKKQYHIHATLGKQKFVIAAQRGSCVGYDSVEVTGKPYPVIAASRDTFVCKGGVATITASSSIPGTAFRWMRNQAEDTFVRNPLSATTATISLDSTQVFTVEANANGCITFQQCTVRVHPVPIATASPNVAICKGDQTTLSVEVPGLRTVQWSPTTGLNDASSPTPIASPQTTTTYTATVTDSNNCVTTASTTVTVKEHINISLSASVVQGVTAGLDTTISIQASASKNIVTPLHFNVHLQQDIFQPADASMQGTINGNERVISFTLSNIPLTSTPSVVATIPGKVLIAPSLGSSISFSTITVDPIYCPDTVSKGGFISVLSCFASGRSIKLSETLAVRVAPNPTTDNTAIIIHTTEQSPVSVSITDAIGRTIRTFEFQHTVVESSYPISLEGIASGIYVVSVKTALQQQTLQLVKAE